MLRFRFFLTALVLLVLGPCTLNAADLLHVLTGYSLTSWGQKDGLPPSVIWAIARDQEGYLWLGTDSGPMRFDGVRFVSWRTRGSVPLPEAPVRALRAGRDGSLWLGFGEPGGVSRLLNGQVQNYGREHGLAEGAITMLLDEPDGSVWAGNRQGLYRFAGDRWVSSGSGLPKSVIFGTFVDGVGNRFVGTAAGLFRRKPAQASFERLEGFDGAVRDIVGDAFGRIWVADPVVGFRGLDSSRDVSVERGNGSSLLHDSKGNLWVGTFGQGLWRVPTDPTLRSSAVERTTSLNGFSDDGVTAIVEDADGSIWVATYDGLNRLVPHKMTPVMNLGVIGGIEETGDGSVWLGAVDALIRFERGQVKPHRAPQAFHGALPSAMHADRSGTLWVATDGELLRIVDGKSSVMRFPDGPLDQISAITSDVQNDIWLADRERGVFRWSHGRLKPVDLPSDLVRVQVLCSLGDRSGQVWLSFADGRVAVADGQGKTEIRVTRDKAADTVVRALYEDSAGVMWLGRSDGLARFANGVLTTLSRANGFPTGSVISIVGDATGELWIGLEGIGIARVGLKELRKAGDDPSYQIRYRLYDKFDGFAGAPRWRGNSGTARSEDGRLWFVSARGVTVVDPRTIEGDRAVPVRVSIEGGVVDGRRIQVVQPALLPPRTAGVEIDYTVPNLVSPLKTRFRYRLEGFDAEWIEAGARRQAFYTNLPPRQYRFRVQASNADGTWNMQDAAWDFAISPRFYQTRWFMAGCIGTIIIGSWAAWRLRIRQVRKQFSLLLGERMRLSREIHDTVLQGLFGLGLQCDAIAGELEAVPLTASRERLILVRREADEFVREARQSILNLRSPKLQSGDLATVLRQAGERATAGHSIAFDMAISGTPSGDWAIAEEQVYRIAQEALANAVRHGQPRDIRVEVCYSANTIVLRVSDDGRGFNLDSVIDANGHCGLLSMKERAEAVGGRLTITTAVGHGTQIEAAVPRSPGARQHEP